jgi:hypothetical protein
MPTRFRLITRVLTPLAAVLFAGTALSGVTPVPPLTLPQLKCERAIVSSASEYVRRALNAREDCFNRVTRGKLPPTTDCSAATTGDASTDNAVAAAQSVVAASIQNDCLGVDLTTLGFPGLCPDATGTPFDSLDLEQCVIAKSDTTIDYLLGYEHPPFPGQDLALVELNCQETIAGKAASMFYKEVERRALDCEQKRLEAKLAATVNCRAEVDPLLPGTGDNGIDQSIVFAHDDVLRGIASSCEHADLVALGFPHQCPNPDGSFFSVAAVTDCMYVSHHNPLIDFIDTIIPGTKMCGNCVLDPENGEQCDDGNNAWEPGQICRVDCSQVTLCGDADDSGTVTILDALFILRTSVELETCHPSLCDIGGDGAINTNDALRALRFAVGLPTDFNCPVAPPADLVCPVPPA